LRPILNEMLHLDARAIIWRRLGGW
jgi:hypothetical protein